jgi:hypothetical protein
MGKKAKAGKAAKRQEKLVGNSLQDLKALLERDIPASKPASAKRATAHKSPQPGRGSGAETVRARTAAVVTPVADPKPAVSITHAPKPVTRFETPQKRTETVRLVTSAELMECAASAPPRATTTATNDLPLVCAAAANKTVSTFTHLPAKADAPDAEQIKQFVSERGIKRLVHLTTFENLKGITTTGAILSRRILDANGLAYAPFDSNRIDRRCDCVNLSITYYNFYMFYGLVCHSDTPCALLHIKPDGLWKMGTLFSPVNAARNRGAYLTSGMEGLKALYADQVCDKGVVQDRQNKPLSLPTHIQAEVLVPDGIPLQDIIEIAVRDNADAAGLKASGWKGKVEVNGSLFVWQDSWFNKPPRDTDSDF